MINAISIALTGLDSASTRLNASASNIANTLTPDYTPQDTISKTDSAGGVQTTIAPRPAPFENDLTREIVDLKLAEFAYKANLETINTATELFDELLDIFDDD